MYTTLRVDDSAVTWLLLTADATALAASLTDQTGPVAVPVHAPLRGRLILSPAAIASALLLPEPPARPDWLPSHIDVPAGYLYLASGAAPTEATPGHRLPAGTDLVELEDVLTAAMRDGTVARVDVGQALTTGQLVVNGANLTYAVLSGPAAPHSTTGQ